MAKYLIDANLPYYFSVWHGEQYIHQCDLGDSWTDEQIWDYAQENNLIIVTKDSDFSNKLIAVEPPPKVVHLRIGNMKMKEFHDFISGIWPEVEEKIKNNKLVNVYSDKILTIED